MNREGRAEEPQNALRCARRRIPSAQSPGERLSRQELADAVNAWIYQRSGRTLAADAIRPILDLQPEHRLATFGVKIDQVAEILQRTSVSSSVTAVRLREELDAYQYTLAGRRQLTRGPHKEKIQ